MNTEDLTELSAEQNDWTQRRVIFVNFPQEVEELVSTTTKTRVLLERAFKILVLVF